MTIRVLNIDPDTVTDEMVENFAKEVGLSKKDARQMLIDILDEEAAI